MLEAILDTFAINHFEFMAACGAFGIADE